MKPNPTTEELINANKKLFEKNEQNEKQIAEQSVLLQQLKDKNVAMEKQYVDLEASNQQLIIRNEEREKLTLELGIAYKQLKKADNYLKEYITGLEEMMHMTSHKVRKPVANILGIANIISNFINSPSHLKKLVKYLKTSATTLDVFTKELTTFIHDLEQKGKLNQGDPMEINRPPADNVQ